MNPAITSFAEHIYRRDASPIKCCIIDYGISSVFDDQGRMVKGLDVPAESPDVSVDDNMDQGSKGYELDPERLTALKVQMHVIARGIELPHKV